jgi:hypothetical protein
MRSLTPVDQLELDQVLREELVGGPNAVNEVRIDSGGHIPPCGNGSCSDHVYIATPLSYRAYLAVHRRLTPDELGIALQTHPNTGDDLGLFILTVLTADLWLGSLMTAPGL